MLRGERRRPWTRELLWVGTKWTLAPGELPQSLVGHVLRIRPLRNT